MPAAWTTSNPRNRLRVAGLLWAGSIAAVVWASLVAEASVAGLVLTLMTWTCGGLGLMAGWTWLRGDADRWQIWFLGVGLVLAVGIFWALATGIGPVIAVLLPFYATATWLAPTLQRSHDEQWADRQRANESREFSPDSIPTDPLLAARDASRKEGTDSLYAATLRELKARLRQSEGDPWK